MRAMIMNIPRVNPLIVFFSGAACAASGIIYWAKIGGDIPSLSPRASNVSGANPLQSPASTEEQALRDATNNPYGYVKSDDAYRDDNNIRAFEKMASLGLLIKNADPAIRKQLLDRENELVCLKCGEVNPGTKARGYSGHICREIFTDYPMKHTDSPGDWRYGEKPASEYAKQLADATREREQYEEECAVRTLRRMSSRDRQKLIMDANAPPPFSDVAVAH